MAHKFKPGVNIEFELEQIHLQLRQLQMSLKPVGASTAAEWVTLLRKEGRLRVDSDSLSFFLEQNAANWWPTPSVPSFPPVGSTAFDVCQPFVSARIDDLLRCGGRVHRRKLVRLPGTSKYRQTTKRVEFGSQPYDGHGVMSFSSHVVGFCGDRRGGTAITIIGEVRGCSFRREDFSGGEVGQLLDMGADLLTKEQFTRTSLYCFLTDGYRFQFFKCSRRQFGEDIRFEQSRVYGGERGWQV